MSLIEVHRRYGGTTLGVFAALIAVFLLLRAIRRPIALMVTVIEAALHAVDRAATAGLSTPDDTHGTEFGAESGSRRGGQSRQEHTHRAGVSSTQQNTGETSW